MHQRPVISVVLVQISPIRIADVLITARKIADRINEISFDAMMCVIHFITRFIGWSGSVPITAPIGVGSFLGIDGLFI